MSIPSAVFNNPTPNIHRTTITPHLSPDQRNAIQRMEQAQQEQVQFESALRERFQQATTLTAAALGLSEQARRRRRQALIGERQAALEQLDQQELQQRQQIAHQFASYAGEASANAAARGVSDSRAHIQDQVQAAEQANRASRVAQMNRAATEQQFLRQTAFQAEQEDINFMQEVIAAGGDLSALRHQTRSQLMESRARLRSLQVDTEAQRQQFLQQNLQEGIQRFQQRVTQQTPESDDIFERLGFE